jgi:glycosyltransferase involved in cell wall biosynthesis
MKLRFVVPDSDLFQSGGNLYNSQLVQALRKRNEDVQIIDFEEFRIGGAEKNDNIYFIDSLYLDKVRDLKRKLKNCYLIVHHLESLYPGEEDADIVFEKKELPVLTRLDGFLTSSNFTKQYLFEKGLTDQRYIVILPALSFKPKLIPKQTSSIKAIMVANLVERKGIYPFLKTILQSKIIPEKCQIQIAGSSDIEPDYARKCLDLISSNDKLSKIIKYLGSYDSQQIQDLYQQSNLFISTSFMETFGMALQEAAAFRLPILALDGGNANYHVEERKNGFSFPSISSLVKKLETLSLDNPAFKKVVESAWDYEKPEQYSWENAAELFLQKLNQDVAGRV